MKNFIVILIIILIGVGAYFVFQSSGDRVEVPTDGDTTEDNGTDTDTDSDTTDNGDDTTDGDDDTQTTTEGETTIGTSADGNDITAYHYGTGSTELLFVGGIHGGYSWGTSLVAYELMDHLESNPDVIPSNVRVTVVPTLNPDGLEEVIGTTGRFTRSDAPASSVDTTSGRFNGNGVDLNRNFDCEWQSTGTWQQTSVDGGTEPFSEPEARAIRDYVTANNPAAAVVWYSAAGGVYASACGNGVLPETTELTNLYADASGYPAYESFDFYEITGDMVNWLAKEDIPAISVLLSSHGSVEWSMNREGVEAILEHYAQ